MARPVPPDTADVVPLLAIGAQALQPDAAGGLVELAAREEGAGGADRLDLVEGALNGARPTASGPK